MTAPADLQRGRCVELPGHVRALHRGDLLFEFTHGLDRYRIELQSHLLWGVEAVFFRNGAFLRCGHFYTRELAMQWAERERSALLRPSNGDIAIDCRRQTVEVDRQPAAPVPIGEPAPAEPLAAADDLSRAGRAVIEAQTALTIWKQSIGMISRGAPADFARPAPPEAGHLRP
ncbi:MAG TPA: hypothetical protein VKD69_04410 [Vicinamibacterales bacterium]|nr:hypothetical protein [Vicinamibacterales bacterium]